MAQLLLKDINKIYPNGFHAVHDFNLEINDGEFLVFVGPSGCGKSTTLRMIAGLENISKGELFIDGKLANEKSPRDRGIAMVFQSYALYPHLTVYENLAFGLTLEGIDEDIIEEKVNKVAEILGLTDYLERLPRALSGGQRQRVAVGRAIIRKVDVFLMDEPLSNLDAKQRVTMRSEIIQIHRDTKATTVYVTHDQTEAMTMADRIVVMKAGYAQQVGTPHDLYFHPANMFVAGFIGEPPMNFVRGEITEKHQLAMDNSDVLVDLTKLNENFDGHEGKRAVFGFRPEAVTVIDEKEKVPADCYVFDVAVELTEMLGDQSNVYCRIGQNNVILKTPPNKVGKRDEKCRFVVPYESIYVFDEETEEYIN